jgi:cell wall-associated NlpC family hydrolase
MMAGASKRLLRLAVVATLVLPSVLFTLTASWAEPSQTSQAEVDAARARLNELGHQLEIVIEQYNDARYQLQLTRDKLAEAERDVRISAREANLAMTDLAARAVAAYTGMGSQVDGLLAADNLSDFSDRLQFMGAVAQEDMHTATEAEVAGQRAEWAAERLAELEQERENTLSTMESRLGDVRAMLDQQEAVVAQLQSDRSDWLAYLDAQRQAADQAAAAPEVSSAPQTGGYVPPANASAAQVAIGAAMSVLGTQYVWGSADPNVGFDCSGLTMWAWAQAGVSLPHSSAAQRSAVPSVPLNQIQPGDLIFYYSPTSHVALYIGNGQIVHARHPGPSGVVQVSSLYGYSTPIGAGRPG